LSLDGVVTGVTSTSVSVAGEPSIMNEFIESASLTFPVESVTVILQFE